MKKAFNVVFNIVKILLIIFLCFEICYLCMAAMDEAMENRFRTDGGYYGKNPVWLADSADTVIDDIYANIDTVGAETTAYNIYRKACEKLMLVPAYGLRAKCDIDVTSGDISLTCASNRTEQYKVAATPVLNANQKVYSSYTNTIYITDANDAAMATLLKGAVQFATRGYSDGENSYIQKGDIEAMDGEEEVITWKTSYEPDTPSASRTYTDDAIRDKCNFIITPDTIVPGSVEIKKEQDEDGADLYHITMDLDCTDDSENGATYYEVKAIKDLLGKNMKSLVYSQLKIDMTIYSNGYLKYWDTIQEWTLKYEVGLFKLSGTAVNNKHEVFSYDAKECEVVNFTEGK